MTNDRKEKLNATLKAIIEAPFTTMRPNGFEHDQETYNRMIMTPEKWEACLANTGRHLIFED